MASHLGGCSYQCANVVPSDDDTGLRLSDSNRTILDAKALHLVLQWVERCLERCRLMRHGVRGLERCQLPGENLSDRRRNKQRLIDSLWTQIPETRQK